MNATFYTAVSLCACGALYLLWALGFRKLFLEDFRDALFVVRKRLYALSANDDIDCDSPAYRSVESLINGAIRYAHRFSIATFILSQMYHEERSKRDGYVDVSAMIRKQIEELRSPYVRAELNGILHEVGVLLLRYIAKSSLSFICFSLTLGLLQITRPKERAVSTFEREAFVAYNSEREERSERRGALSLA